MFNNICVKLLNGKYKKVKNIVIFCVIKEFMIIVNSVYL